jgi:hypothetical protein
LGCGCIWGAQRVWLPLRRQGPVGSWLRAHVYGLCRPVRAGTWFRPVFPGLHPGLFYGAPLELVPFCRAALTGRGKVALGTAQGIRIAAAPGALKERHNPMPRKYGRTRRGGCCRGGGVRLGALCQRCQRWRLRRRRRPRFLRHGGTRRLGLQIGMIFLTAVLIVFL